MFLLPLPYLILEVLIFATWVRFYGFLDVFLAYLAPSLLGVLLFSMMGRRLLLTMQSGFQQGQMPGNRVLQHGAVLLGSVLLIVPLFIPRVLAVMLILPGLRHLCVLIFKVFIFKRISKMPFSFVHFGSFGQTSDFHQQEEPRHERDADVVNVTPIEITHTKIQPDSVKKDDEDPSSPV